MRTVWQAVRVSAREKSSQQGALLAPVPLSLPLSHKGRIRCPFRGSSSQESFLLTVAEAASCTYTRKGWSGHIPSWFDQDLAFFPDFFLQ